MGKKSHIAPFGYLLIDNNKVTIGDDVAIGPFCTFICHSNSVTGKSKLYAENYLDGDIFIGNNVFIGVQCTILPGTIIEDNVVIASNSVVKGRIERSALYGGTPAKKIKEIE
ncbi:MAG TPA: acyltransferase [Crocinitomicaceae bacterium]|nr:acyltransferase [Crocinitomicaceae bacterium]